jgi:HAD superfamily hydrolase (TIGR01549 family)
MLKHPIDTIIFDLDGTLRYNVPSADDTQYNYALQLGVNDTPGRQRLGARWAHYYWAQSGELFDDLARFERFEDDFWVHYSFRYLRALTVPNERATHMAPGLYQLMKDGFAPENRLRPDVPETLSFLRASGFTLGLVSNRSNPCQEECEQLGLLGYFEFAYVAAEVDAWKPDPHIFDRALEQTGSLPESTIYVGDNYYADIVGAKNAGLQPVLIDPDGIFPEAECAVIKNVGELVELVLHS